jgi:CubicO group peptidase (beta-lactamase class C family)
VTHRARASILALALLAACSPARVADRAPVAATAGQRSDYFPEPGDRWQRRRPQELGVDSAKLADAVAFARASEIGWLRDMAVQVPKTVEGARHNEILGPTRDRAGQNGIVLRGGYIVAEWGETDEVDMTFSVAKSYLATVAGLALDRGLIRDVNDPVRLYVQDGGFDSEHNRPITWHMMLNQTNEWEGTLWDKPDSADRRAGYDRALKAPGTFWEYNDVRVNRTALALLRVWREPLPAVLRREVMDPIGATRTWEWHGYRNSYVTVDGYQVQSVSGGGHWGGGVWASTRDHARFGYLMLRRGRWGDRRILSERWVRMATTPTPIRPVYGYMWWLNTERKQFAAASPSSFFALGAGGNTIWIDPERDLVVVTRWLDTRATNEFMRRVSEAVPPR